MKNGDQPVHPIHPDSSGADSTRNGLTKREEFAKAAMQGLLSAGNNLGSGSQSLALTAVACADDLLKQLKDTPSYY